MVVLSIDVGFRGNSGHWPDFEGERLKTVFPLGRDPDLL